MAASASRWTRVREWIRRYLPYEIAGTVAEFSAAALVHAVTGSLAAAAVAATVAATAGYYAAAYLSALLWSFRGSGRRGMAARVAVANLLALRSIAIEFGPAEVLDSVFVRPLAFYLGPTLFGDLVAGWVIGKLVSDAAFYACAITSYERFTALLAHRQAHRPPGKEEDHESTATVSSA